MINILRTLMEKQTLQNMNNISREIEILRKNQKEMVEIKNIVMKTTNAFGGLIIILDTAEERISELKDMSGETSEKEEKKERVKKMEPEYPKTAGQL